jgi:hypothetical protein
VQGVKVTTDDVAADGGSAVGSRAGAVTWTAGESGAFAGCGWVHPHRRAGTVNEMQALSTFSSY